MIKWDEYKALKLICLMAGHIWRNPVAGREDTRQCSRCHDLEQIINGDWVKLE